MKQQALSKEAIRQLADNGRKSLFFLSKAILGFDKVTKDIHLEICNLLQDYKTNKRLALILPRGWYKSTLATICYPIWRAINNPEVRILLVQNTYTNACGKLGAIKQIFETNELFKMLYPEILPTLDSVWAKDAASVNRKGAYPEATFEAAGTGTQKTGQHYDLIIEDDTVSPDKDNLTGAMMQPTQAEIEKAIGWFRLATPLLIEPVDSQRVIVGTRWAEADLLGYILKNHPEYLFVTRAVRETNRKPDSKGTIQWPARFDDSVLKALEVDLGPYCFSSLYMNEPCSAANQVFTRDWIHYYQTLPINLICCTSIDLASADMTESSDPDFNVILTTGVQPSTGNIYIIHYTRERMSPSSVINAIFDHHRAYKPVRVILEGIGYQRTMKHWLEQKQRQQNQMFFIDVITSHQASKVDRIRGLQPFFAAGRFFLRPGMDDLERELLAFPRSTHDDLIDALSMQLSFWNTSSTLKKEDDNDKIMKNPFSADVIINELQRRSQHAWGPLYDMGIMKHQLNNDIRGPYKQGLYKYD